MYEKRKLKVLEKMTSSYFWVSASRSSSDMSGLKTIIVSYCLRPGGHWGSSFSSTPVKPGPPGEEGSSSEPKPPSKNESEKSRVWALMENPLSFLFGQTGFWECERMRELEKIKS